MKKSICLIQGHPHNERSHLCHALADAYEDGARSAALGFQALTLADMDFPLLGDPRDFLTPPPPVILEAQNAITRADHVVIVYPLWLGTMPALVKGFFEQLSRHEFAIAQSEKGWPRKMLKGRSAHVIVTMGMPATAYRLIFGAHGLKAFEGGILGMAGFNPIRDTLVGGVDNLNNKKAEALFARMRNYGAQAK